MPKITVIGSFVAGLTVKLPRQPMMGESIMSSVFDFGPGGKGFNQAIALKRLGIEVSLAVKVGKDMFAHMAKETLKKEGIPLDYLIETEEDSTGVGLVYLYENGENTIGFYNGANALLGDSDVRLLEHEIQNSDLVLSQLEVSDDAVLTAFQIAKRNNVMTMLNPAPARAIPDEVLALCDIISPNEGELKLLSKLEMNRELEEYELVDLSTRLQKKGPQEVIVTLGSRGAFLLHKGEYSFHNAIPISVVDSVGAGDCFTAGYATARVHQLPINECMLQALVNGGLATTQLGVVDAIPYKSDVENYIKNKEML